MTSLTTDPNFSEFVDYLYECERAADPPPDIPANALMRGVFPASRTLLGGAMHARKFSDMCAPKHIAVAPDAPMPAIRHERVATLLGWMKHFPAYAWLHAQPAVRAAHKSFGLVRKRSANNPLLSDDLAEFRFWRVAAWAGLFRDLRHTPSANAAERKSAEKAVRRLLQLCNSSRLLSDAGMEWRKQQEFRRGLDCLLTISTIEKRPRTDDYSSDREYIKTLTQAAWRAFRVAPPSIVISLAALKVSNPEQVSITKLVKQEARRLAAEPT